MHAIVRRYEGIDSKRTDELKRKVDDNLMPSLTKLPGFISSSKPVTAS